MFWDLDIRNRVMRIIVLTILHFLNWHTHGAAVNLNPVCETEECQKLGKMLLNSMNKNVSACSNFYDYVCGQWSIHNPRPETYDVWSNYHTTELEELKQVKRLLESTDESTPEYARLKQIYKACMKIPYLERSPPEVITKIMTIVGHWPIFLPTNKEITAPWSIIDNEYIKRTGESAIFDLSVVLATGKDKKQYVVSRLAPMFSPYGTITRTIEWGMLSTQKKNYKKSLYKIIEAVAPVNLTYFVNNIDKDLNDVINFREDLRQMIDKLPEHTMEEFTIKEFEELYNNGTSRDDTAKIDWSQKLDDIYKSLSNPRFYDTAHTIVYADKPYFLKLARLLKKTKKRVIANHIHLYFAERHLILPSDVQHEIQQSFSSGSYGNGGIREERFRWKWCLEEHNYQALMRKMYTEALFPLARRAETVKLFVETKNLIKQQISESTWLDKNMIEKSIEKITNMTSLIGYSVVPSFNEPGKIALDPLKTDMYYHRAENAVCVAAATLRAPVYDIKVPYVIQYGATVSVFGHEVYHVFHRNALKHDCYGQTWWESTARKKFKAQLQCFEKQYNEKRNRELIKYGIREWDFGPDSSSEDVSDVMGVKAAYKGYKQMLEKSKGTCSVLPGFEKTSCDQLFFIAFAHTLCSDYSYNGKKLQLLTDEHSPPSIRVNGVASNMEEFGTAFGCAPTDPLMQTKRCDIWKN